MKCIEYFASGGVCVSNLIITGGSRLCGIIEVPGAKNSVLPVLAATLLNKGTSILEIARVDDVTTMLEILRPWAAVSERRQG